MCWSKIWPWKAYYCSHPIWGWFEAGSELLWGLWQRFSLNLNQENRMTKSWPTQWRLNSSSNLLCKNQKHRRRDWSSIWRLESLSNWAISHIWLVAFQNAFQILTTPSTTWEMTIMKSTTSWLEAHFQKNVCWKLTSKLRANTNNQHPDWGSFLFCSRNPTEQLLFWPKTPQKKSPKRGDYFGTFFEW